MLGSPCWLELEVCSASVSGVFLALVHIDRGTFLNITSALHRVELKKIIRGGRGFN